VCLAVPGQVESIRDEEGTRMGRVNFGGVVKDVCLAFLPAISVGDYALVHVGFAIARLDETAARETLAAFAMLEAAAENAPDPAEHPGPAPGDSCRARPQSDPIQRRTGPD